MLFADEKKVREACAKCLADPADVHAYDDLLTGCRSMGRSFLRLYNIVPPTMERMVYHPYQGTGMISFNKSIAEFCNKGKSLDGMIARERRRDVRKVRFAVIYDDSNSMTAWWRNTTMAENARRGRLAPDLRQGSLPVAHGRPGPGRRDQPLEVRDRSPRALTT